MFGTMASPSPRAGGNGTPPRSTRAVGRSGEPRPHDEGRIGKAVHSVTGRLLSDGLPAATAREILAYVASEPLLSMGGTYWLGARARVSCLTAVYLRRLLPPHPWSYVDHQVPLSPRGDLDLVFEQTKTRMVRVDELKTGAPAWSERDALEEQIQRELAGGGARFGTRFAGLRVLYLAAPTQSFVVSPDGTRAQLPSSERDD